MNLTLCANAWVQVGQVHDCFVADWEILCLTILDFRAGVCHSRSYYRKRRDGDGEKMEWVHIQLDFGFEFDCF